MSPPDHVFAKALILAVALHLSAALGLLLPGPGPDEGFRELASMEFETYDPLGGTPGGERAEAIPESEIPDQPEEPAEGPEPLEDPPEIVESVSERAEPQAPPPPKEPPKERPRPRPKPKPRAQAPPGGERAAAPADGAGGGPGTGQGGVGGGTGKGNPDAVAAYQTTVRRRLERYKKYPPVARSGRMEGTATVRFTLNRSGRVVQSQLVKSSGHRILDDEVMALMRRAEPFPGFPKEIPDQSMTLTAPIRFYVRGW
jgi:protein TonB